MPLPPVAFYLTSHGFGHASRQKPLMRQLLARGIPTVFVRVGLPQGFFDDVSGVEHHQQRYDVGVVQDTALDTDVEATIHANEQILQDKERVIQSEVAFLRSAGVGIVIGDIPPLAFEIAQAAGIPSVAISHFTWDWIYNDYAAQDARFSPIVEAIQAMYHKATLALEMPFGPGFDQFPKVQPNPLLVETPTITRAELAAQFHVPAGKKLALFTFGGMDWPAEHIVRMGELANWIFLVPQRLIPPGDIPANIRVIPRDYPSFYNIMANIDLVITKAGGTTVAECVAYRKPIIYTIRDNFIENGLLIAALERYTKSLLLDRASFERGDWLAQIDAFEQQSVAKPTLPANGAEVAAGVIIGMLQ